MKTPWQYAETGNEFSHQVALFMWANMAANFGLTASKWPDYYTTPGMAKQSLEYLNDAIPELQWLHAIKNAGHGDAIRGARSAAEGVKAGVPDIFLPVARPMYSVLPQDTCGEFWHGFYVELKRPVKYSSASLGASASIDKQIKKRAGVVDPVQIKWRDYLRNAGYCVETCYGWEDARDRILVYLGRG